MASVLLPTREWTPSCGTLAAQLAAEDELWILCDRPDDPVARHPPELETAAAVEVLPAGPPEGSSGKAHALAAGLEASDGLVVILTDDDVDRDQAWLARLKRLVREHGAVSMTPVFVGSGPVGMLAEPLLATFVSVTIARYGGVWGGGVAFDRCRIDEASFRRDLERTVSDDALLWDALGEVYTDCTLANDVRLPDDPGDVFHCLVRFVLTFCYWLPRATAGVSVLSLVFLVLLALGTPFALAIASGLAARSYRCLGVERRTWLLAAPAALFLPVVVTRAVLNPTFRWGDRRYAWTGRFRVRVESRGD